MTPLMTVPEASEASRIPYGTLLRLIHEEKLRAVKLPGRRSFLIDPADLNGLIQASKSGADHGTELETVPSQAKENAAPKKRSHQARRRAVIDGKFQWMEAFGGRRAE